MMATGPFETETDARHASLWGRLLSDDDLTIPEANMTDLETALAGVELGAYDKRIIAWLAGYEPATVAVVCGLISRAREAGAT